MLENLLEQCVLRLRAAMHQDGSQTLVCGVVTTLV
jgi:hypothetical protein